ncbi:MAG TPA: dipeptidase [Vicinamibacterales bacterium]|nr:dipeptidase [Vicinamibacterales bacterium]
MSVAAAALMVVTDAPVVDAQGGGAAEAELLKRARAIHDRVITLDTHDDINPDNFTRQRNYTQDLPTQVNLPKMFAGGLDASFFIVYVGQGDLTPAGYADAYQQAVAKFDAIHHLTKEIASDKIELALTAADVPRIAATGKKVALIGIENAYPLGTDLGRIKEFYDRGGRYMSLAHNGHSQLSDSNTGERDGKWLHNGLSEMGRKAIAEMNRLGIMVDVSHPSKASMMQTVALSKAPIIASHSAARALADHSRNMDDQQLLALKKNGGVIQTVAFNGYVKIPPPVSAERTAALAALRKDFGIPTAGPAGGGGQQGAAAALAALSPARRADYEKQLAVIDFKMPPPPRATVRDFVTHIDYIVTLIGIDHVGISSDFDGGGGVDGWNDASETFNVTLELVRRGYTEAEIAKLWSGNLLRVMAAVEKVAGR